MTIDELNNSKVGDILFDKDSELLCIITELKNKRCSLVYENETGKDFFINYQYSSNLKKLDKNCDIDVDLNHTLNFKKYVSEKIRIFKKKMEFITK
jgi:hypothetical protein